MTKLSVDEVECLIGKWKVELSGTKHSLITDLCDRPKPWKRKRELNKSDVVGKLHIVLSDGVYVDSLNLMPRIQNQIRSLAAFDNPVYYKNKRLGYSNYNNFSSIYLGKDVDGYICIPRGLREVLISLCEEAGIEYDILDYREKGRPIKVSFKGDLRTYQELAANKMLSYDHGILSATTAFGKTVVCSYLIAKRKVNTLILLQNKELLEQWVEELNKFLNINEELPIYFTKSGRKKKRGSVIGILSGNKNTLNGIIDVAMVGSVYAKGDFNKYINSYGMIIMDECHHCGSNTSVSVMRKINARYVYGVSATPNRGDNLEKIIYMLLGPIRHSFTAKERAKQQGIGHFVYPRFTKVVDVSEFRNNINAAYNAVSNSQTRNLMIIEDTKSVVAAGRTPVILTKYKEQARKLYENLQGYADNVFLFYGDNSDKENADIRRKLKDVANEQSLILIATGQKIGEGFDFPRLDTLMLATPVSFSGRLEQYVGRLHRDYVGKKDVIVYDYIDFNIKVFENMYMKRLRTYKRLGYSVVSNMVSNKQFANSIYDFENYIDVFEQDLVEATKSIIISSPQLIQSKVDRFINITSKIMEAGCRIIVITTNVDDNIFGNMNHYHLMMKQMEEAGIHIIVKEEVNEHFAVMDEDIVWHGSMNFLGKEDVLDNLIRIKSATVAEELLELALGKNKTPK